MSMNYVLLALVAIALITGLVAFGVGHKRWSWGTVVAAFLVLLSGAGYLYVAARLAAYEWAWTSLVRSKQVQLARQRDALAPDTSEGSRLRPIAGEKSLETLADERKRWQRALDRIETWHGRSWPNAAFQPPKADGETGKVEVPVAAAAPAAEGAAEGAPEAAPAEPAKPVAPPFDPGSTVYLFEEVPVQDGGRYLGEFLVGEVVFDAASNRHVLTVEQTEPRDEYDTVVWGRNYDAVTVYESLPADRWIAFTKADRAKADGGVIVPDTTRPIDEVEGMISQLETFLTDVKKHLEPEPVEDKEEWAAIRARLTAGEEPPGIYWAKVRFKEPVTVAEGLVDEESKRSFEMDEVAEFDLQTAFDLADKGSVEIESVQFRRRLSDARTAMHGVRIFHDGEGGAEEDTGITTEGVAGLLASLRQDIANLDLAIGRLVKSQESIDAELAETRDHQKKLTEDLESWTRDAAAAERTAVAFQAEVDRTGGRLAATEKVIVARAAELRRAIASLVDRIDAVAPPPARPASATP
jgi:hypothetical protein